MIDEGARFALHRRLSEVLGEDPAVTLMSHLPPSGWSDVATRHDIARLEERIGRLDERMDRLEARFAPFEQHVDERIQGALRTYITTTIAAVFASALTTLGIVLGMLTFV